MSALAPASLLVRPSNGVVMHSLIEANPAAPLSCEPGLPELFRRCLRVCRDLERAVTVAELAARMGRSPAVLGVVVAELADVDLVRSVRAPARAERLRAWATSTRPVPMVAVSVLAPVLVWVLPGLWWSPMIVLPPTWSLLSLPGYPGDTLPSLAIPLGGVATAAAVALALVRRIRSRLIT